MPDPVGSLVALALDEDLGDRGDVTAAATIPADAVGRARFVARHDGVVAGLETLARVCGAVDHAIEVVPVCTDGARVAVGDVIAEVTGPARSLLAAERTALNFLTHLSGVATETARWAAALAGTGCVVRDTRKTLPGMRLLEKSAVAAGGGVNHRIGLYDAVLVKDNHVQAVGGVAAATRAALAAEAGLDVQVEVDSLEQLDEALDAGARSVLLDNFDLAATAEAVQRCRAQAQRIFVEASGGLTLERARAVAETGVDALAVGAITHSAPALDIALDWSQPATLDGV